jgi:hypothetical protein
VNEDNKAEAQTLQRQCRKFGTLFLFFNLVIFEPYDKKLVQRSLDGLGYLPSVIGEQKLIEVSDKVYPRWIRRGE